MFYTDKPLCATYYAGGDDTFVKALFSSIADFARFKGCTKIFIKNYSATWDGISDEDAIELDDMAKDPTRFLAPDYDFYIQKWVIDDHEVYVNLHHRDAPDGDTWQVCFQEPRLR